ncbi:MAG: FAD-dependent oxidoreductase [Armatimonadota bacterium]
MMTPPIRTANWLACLSLALVAASSQCASGATIAEALAAGLEPAYDCDVCVLGGGPSGTAAAIAAARNGADTLLIEQYGFLGGMGTVASVNVFMTYQHAGGIFREMLGRLDAIGGRRGSCFDVAKMQVVLDDMVQQSGAKPLFYTRGIAALTAPGKTYYDQQQSTVTGLLIHNKSGIQLVRARVFIDCTGDGDLAAWAGARVQVGRKEDGVAQPMTMCFRMGGCTYEGGSLMQYPGLKDYWASYAMNPNPGEITLNMTRILDRSGISGEDMTAATIEGRKQVMKAVRILKENVPGFENAYLLALPTQIGVRETRHVMGATVLTGEQCIEGMERGDVMARCKYNIDIHNPAGTGAMLIRLEDPYDIPYRCLIPLGVDNLLVAGRAISADHVAHSSLRIQPTCYALGQAAGTAAAICAREGIGPWDMADHLRELQATLVRSGADLGRLGAKRVDLEDEWERWQIRYRRSFRGAPPGGFTDIPRGHPAYDAAMGLARVGVFQGYPGGTFGADDPATPSVAWTVVDRARAAIEPLHKAPRPAPLPDRLRGQYWSDPLGRLVARGIVSQAELADLDARAPLTRRALKALLLAAFPETTEEQLDTIPAPADPAALARAELAMYLWEALGPLLQ